MDAMPSSHADQASHLEAEAQRQKTVLLYRNAGIAQLVTIVNAGLLAYVNATLLAPSGAALAWWCLVVVIAGGRYLLARRFMEAQPEAVAAIPWRRRYIGATALMAAAWGAGTVLFVWDAPDGARLFTGLVLSGMVAGAVPILGPVPAAFRTFALLLGVPLAAAIFLQANSPLHWAFASMSLVFLAAVLASARYLHQTLDVAMRLGLEKGHLLENLERARRASEAALEASSLSLWDFDIDAGRIYLDENWVKIVGGDGGERVAALAEVVQAVHPEDRERTARSAGEALKGLTPTFREEIRIQAASGAWKWIRCRGKVVERNASGRALRAVGTNIDITERKRAEEALHTSEARFRLLASATFEGIAMTEQGRFIDANDQLLRMLGYTREELIGLPVTDLFPDEERQRVLDDIQNGQESHIEHAMLRKDGSIIHVEAHGQNNDHEERASRITALRDITERKKNEAIRDETKRQLESQLAEISALQLRLQEQVIRDPLTGLYNRRFLDETLPRELQRAKREGYPLALIMIDLDHFKRVNDTYGHATGDKVLKSLATILGNCARESDLTCRYGGEEFLVALPRVLPGLARQRAEEWRLELSGTPLKHGDLMIKPTLSAGVAGFPDDGVDIDTLLSRADEALYRSKAEGRNRVTCFEAMAQSTV